MLLNENQARAIASHAAIFLKNMPDALTHVRLSPKEDGKVSILATNRYVITSDTITPERAADLTEDVLVPAEILKAMKTAKGHSELCISDTELSFSNGSNTLTVARPTHNFPPIANLLPNDSNNYEPIAMTQALRLNLDLLASLGKLLSERDYKAPDKVFNFYAMPTATPGKPSPIVVKRGSIVCLIQPVLVTD